MSITFNENGTVSVPRAGSVLPNNLTDPNAWAGLQPTGGGTTSGSVFNVPFGPPKQFTEYVPFSEGPLQGQFIPGISAAQQVTRRDTKTNQQIEQEILLTKATDPEAYKKFEDALENSGYSNLDDLLYGAALADQDWEEFLYSRASSGLFGSGGGGGGPTTTVTTNISNRGQAYDAINPQFERGLGRSIGTDELTDFRKTLNKFEKANPYVTNSGRGYSKTTGGFDSSELVRSYVEGQDDYAESQVASNFLGVLDRILQDPNNQPGPDLQTRMDRAGY